MKVYPSVVGMIATYLDIKKMIKHIFDKFLVKIQMSHEKLVTYKTRKKKILTSRKIKK